MLRLLLSASNLFLDIVLFTWLLVKSKIKHLTEKPANNENIAKYPIKIGGVNNYVDNFNIYPQNCCGNTYKKYIFDGLIKL